jgi:asparagine synthase (glutamine-hydrolysing)
VVRDRLRDAPVGILLSGGLDSSSVAAAAVGVLGDDASDRLRAYTFVYDTVAEDEERKYSSVVARHLGSRSSITRSTATDGSNGGTQTCCHRSRLPNR